LAGKQFIHRQQRQIGGFGHNAGMSRIGLYPLDHFVTGNGRDLAGCLLPQAAWYFTQEFVGVPVQGMPLAGYERRLSVAADLRSWAARIQPGQANDYPPLIWLAAPDILRNARVTADPCVIVHDGRSLTWASVPRLVSNGAWLDASSFRFFSGRPQKLRGNGSPGQFCVRCIWPEDFCLPVQPDFRAMAAEPAALREWLRALPQGGAQADFSVEAVWRRSADCVLHAGQPVIGLVLNGAQGDDDEAHGGHFALLTGVVGEQGAIDDWLVYNFYTLDAESEKGIVAAPVPLDNYLADLNAGQAWYRPSCLLVASLRDARTAHHVQSAFGRVFNQFYRHQFAYQHARANCTGISVDALRAIGWQIPVRGPESWLKACLGLPLTAFRERSLKRGKAIFDYFTEDRTKLYPAVAGEEIFADLLNLAGGTAGRKLSEFERLLGEDIEQVLLLRVPQFPSSRPWGDWPVASSKEYQARLPADPAQQKIIPVASRPFPPELRDPLTPRALPLRSDYALAVFVLLLILAGMTILLRVLA
jgi:hypothetical protein